MTLTVKEKEHWKNRITRKIDQAIESILAADDLNYIARIKRQAKKSALESLGIAELKSEVEEIDAETKIRDKKRRMANRHMLAVVRGVDVIDIEDCGYGEHLEVEHAVRRRSELVEKELLAKDDLGRRLLGLRRERDEMLDPVWLATSPNQIKELWATVSSVLEQESTELQKQALILDPMENVKET